MFGRSSLQREGPELEAAPPWGAGSPCDSTRTFWMTVSCRTRCTPAKPPGTSRASSCQHAAVKGVGVRVGMPSVHRGVWLPPLLSAAVEGTKLSDAVSLGWNHCAVHQHPYAHDVAGQPGLRSGPPFQVPMWALL